MWESFVPSLSGPEAVYGQGGVFGGVDQGDDGCGCAYLGKGESDFEANGVKIAGMAERCVDASTEETLESHYTDSREGRVL